VVQLQEQVKQITEENMKHTATTQTSKKMEQTNGNSSKEGENIDPSCYNATSNECTYKHKWYIKLQTCSIERYS
jgi:hypothetical protein